MECFEFKDSMSNGSAGAAATGESLIAGGSFARLVEGSIGRIKKGEAEQFGAEFEISARRDSISCQSTAGSAFSANTTRPKAHSSTLLMQSRG